MTQQFPDDDDWRDDMEYAFEELAVVAENTSYSSGTPEGNARQNAAFQEVAKMIRAMAQRYAKRKRGKK